MYFCYSFYNISPYFLSFRPGGTESSAPALCLFKFFSFRKLRFQIRRKDDLCNPFTVGYDGFFSRMIVKSDHDFSPVIRIDDSDFIGRRKTRCV